MIITKALLADYANIAEGGKLNVLGIFQAIYSLSFPAVHPQMQLIFMWEANRSEVGRKKNIEIQLCDSDGKKLIGIGANFVIPDGREGKKISGNEIITLNNVKFDKSGEYVFNILIDDDHKGDASFELVPIKSKKA